MRILVIEDRSWSSLNELTEAMMSHKEIEIGFCEPKRATNVLRHFNVDVCVIDACSGANRQTSTSALVRQIREFFKGTMIAVSSIPYSRIPLLRAGCTYSCSKGNLPKILILLASMLAEKKQPPKVYAGDIFSPVT
jgi:hypothetical protein